MSDRFRIFFNTFVLYALTVTVGIVAAYEHVIQPSLGALEPMQFGIQDAFVFVGVFVVFTVVMVRFVKIAPTALNIFLVVALVMGIQFVFSPWLDSPLDLAAAITLVAILRLFPRVFIQDIAITLGIAGIGGLLGLALTPLIAAALLAILSIYDILSVYQTRHMVALADQMMRSGAVFGFLVPTRFRGFMMPVSDAIEHRDVMMLGSGDIGLPLILAASAVSTSIAAAAMVAVFSLLGVMMMQWLFVHQKSPMPMAALPPIAASAILGYVVAVLLGV